MPINPKLIVKICHTVRRGLGAKPTAAEEPNDVLVDITFI
jgi:hypothetical protein